MLLSERELGRAKRKKEGEQNIAKKKETSKSPKQIWIVIRKKRIIESEQ